jgi:hypothetical protein
MIIAYLQTADGQEVTLDVTRPDPACNGTKVDYCIHFTEKDLNLISDLPSCDWWVRVVG